MNSSLRKHEGCGKNVKEVKKGIFLTVKWKQIEASKQFKLVILQKIAFKEWQHGSILDIGFNNIGIADFKYWTLALV